jgi:hypothetical protein
MALINTTTTGVLGSTFFGDGTGSLTVQQNGVTLGTYGNIPTFYAYLATAQSVGNSSYVKINVNTKSFDTNNNFDTTNYRFTPTVAGYYQITGQVAFTGSGTGHSGVSLYKNGANYSAGSVCPNNTSLGGQNTVTSTIFLNGTTDYVELYGWQNSGGALNTQASAAQNYLTGTLVKAT